MIEADQITRNANFGYHSFEIVRSGNFWVTHLLALMMCGLSIYENAHYYCIGYCELKLSVFSSLLSFTL